jgi:hypothetical protein
MIRRNGVYIIPRPGLIIPDPDARPPLPRWLPAEGAEVPDTQYWRRAIADGDVVLGEPPARQPSKKE